MVCRGRSCIDRPPGCVLVHFELDDSDCNPLECLDVCLNAVALQVADVSPSLPYEDPCIESEYLCRTTSLQFSPHSTLCNLCRAFGIMKPNFASRRKARRIGQDEDEEDDSSEQGELITSTLILGLKANDR